MGIHNREYLRDESSTPGGWGGSNGESYGGSHAPMSAAKVLVLINIVVFVATWLHKPLGDLLHLPGTFTVIRRNTEVYFPALPRESSTILLTAGTYIVPVRTGPVELERIRKNQPELVDDLDPSFVSQSDDWVAIEIEGLADGKRVSLAGLIQSKDTRSIAWQAPWRMISYGFCHDQTSLWHLAFNMICLWMFGRLIEGIYGRREFVWVYLLGVFVSGLCHLAWQQASGGSVVPMVGASGGVMTVMVLAAIHFPKMKVLVMMIFPVELGLVVVGLVAWNVLGGMGLFGGDTHVAYMAHLGGLAFGFGYHRSGFRLSSGWASLWGRSRLWRRRIVRPSVRVYQPPADGLDEKVDAILEKISRDGEASLSDRDREFLMEASRRKRDEM